MRGAKPAISPLGDDDVVDLKSSLARVPDPPASLKGEARKLWPLVAGELVVRSIYADDCRDMLEAYCVQRARFLAAEEGIREQGLLVQINLHQGPNPLLRVSNDACDRMNRLAQELGLTPVARKRVAKVRGAGSATPAAKFLKQA